MAKKKLNLQWRNRYERAMSDPAFKAQVLGINRDRLVAEQEAARVAAENAGTRLEKLDAEIAALNGTTQSE